MDLSLLQTSASEYHKQTTRANFTVRSANSPSYSLTRRAGIKKREIVEEAGEKERHGRHTGRDLAASVTGQCEEREASRPTGLNQNGTAGKTIPESGNDTSESSVLQSRGRTEWRRGNLSSRSKSLDWRAGARNPDRTTTADTLSSKRREAYTSAGASKVHDKSPLSHVTLDQASRGHTLPSRFRSQSGPGSRFTETSSLSGPNSGQTILERIEKLYGSAGFGKAEDSTPETSVDSLISPQRRSYEMSAGGTFPRRFSSGENNSQVQSRMSFIWSQIDSNTSSSDTSVTPGTSMTRQKSPGQWQGQMQARTSEEGGTCWRKGVVESGTWSLDRARSRNTIAADIRSARAAAARSKEERKSETSGVTEMWRERTEGVREQDKAKEKSELKIGTDDVFETNTEITLKTAGRKKFSGIVSASVRNKINQFEALTQKTQSTAINQIPRRAFSVPTQLDKGHDGVKKSGSAKEIGGQSKRNGVMGTGKKPGSERSLSLDEVGLRLEKKEAEGSDFLVEGNQDSSNDFGKYSQLKKTLELPLNEGAQRRSRRFPLDWTDFSKVSSPEKASDSTDSTPTLLLSCGTSPPVLKNTPSERTSPVSDNDRTPTNIPDDSPFFSPAEGNVTATAENKGTSVSSQGAKSQDPDPPTLPFAPANISLSNLPNFKSPDVSAAYPKGKKRVLDLSAWVAGLNPEFKGWDEDENDYESDDESTQKDEDSNYDSDSGESSVTITSNTSQSDRRSFCVSLSDLCNFAGTDYDSDNDSDEWQSTGRRSASLSSDVSALSCVSVMPAEELDKLLEDVRSLGDDNLQDYDDVHVVVLHKEVGVGLGFSVAGGVDQNKPVTVHKVFPTGVAAQEGSIREGDHVLSINGTALCGSAHWEALRILRRAKTRDMGVVVLRRGDVCCASKKTVHGNNQRLSQAQYETGQRVCVQLQKNSRDLGFSLQGGEGSSLGNKPITVQKIFQGGPVDKVCSGDEVLEIQGVSMVGMTRLEAWTLIRKLLPGPVDVVLRRPLKHLET
ncbi:uncharacterized protein LOC114448215 [Parambassis ranga]|uniref:Uncharacterized protein LOC114448215 n=1 Tax=Parambassis ranga TaxID=210632 RepID=A0A6P7JZ59_9TELE|nr:uncharacterized protein LOC114448215 [Parambassis ranga]XP_028280816.1 uncharacterized protein LOC114448215 [Parambassis ranga]XP_028280817.1 uncharacterized protein LOC114448215 [Parambassis ranga]